MGKKVNKNSEQNNTTKKDLNQLLIELDWSNRSILSSYFALYGIILSVIVRHARRIALLDDINGTNFTENTAITDIIEKYPSIIDTIFLVLAINSVESSFEELINKYNLNGTTDKEIKIASDSLAASYFAFIAAKISYDISSGSQFY